jgi:ferredoxin
MLKRLYSDPTDLMDLQEGVLKGLCLRPPKKVDKPTYEIVGDIERFDTRDHVYSRMAMRPGSPHYEDYYSRHPERKDNDEDVRKRGMQAGKELLEKNRVNEEISISGFYGALGLGHPKFVERFIRLIVEPTGMIDMDDRVEVDPAAMSRKIKAYALHMGAAKVGITELNPKWVYSYDAVPPYGKPIELDYKYVICMAFPQDPFMMANHNGLAQNWEVGWKYSYASFVSLHIANFIRHLGWPTRPVPTFSTPFLVPPVFIDAGIGEDARCGYVITKEVGNNFRPGGVLTDLPLVPDKPVDFGAQDFCDKCGICAERCPSGAIPKGDREVVRGVRKWHIDADKCYRYWNTTGHSCGICQVVCPWNHPNTLFHKTSRELAERVPSLRKALILGEKMCYKYKPAPEPKWLTDQI